MMPLVMHCLRQLRPMLITGLMLLVVAVIVSFATTANRSAFSIVFPFLSLPVWLTGFYLCMPVLASDFLLPVSRKTLFRAKVSSVFLAVVLGLGIPFLLLNTIHAGGLNTEAVRRTVTFVSLCVVGVCVSTMFPTLCTFHVRGALSPGKLFAGGCMIAPYFWLAYLISTRNGFGGFLLAPCMLLIAFIGYRKGARLFSRYELVPQSTPQDLHLRRPRKRTGDSAEIPDTPSGLATAATTPPWYSTLLERVPPSWRVPLLITWFRPLILSVLVVILPSVLATMSLAFEKREPVLGIFFVMMAYLYRLRDGWGSIIKALPGAFPRWNVFSALTLPVLVATVWWAVILSLWITPWAVALVATGFLGSLSFLLWLGILPPPRHGKALRAHRILLQVFFVGLLLLFGLWLVADIYEDSIAARLLGEAASHISLNTICEPSVAWAVSAMCAFLAAIFWAGSFRRFKYMEAVPPRVG